MKEIKYRAWKKVGNPEMYYNLDFIDWKDGNIGFPYRLSRDTVRHDKEPLDNLSLMQYTNMKDKLGTEIYDGDIVRMNCPNQFLCGDYEVRQANSGEWRMDNQSQGRTLYFSLENIEVIGNIYENPELMEGVY